MKILSNLGNLGNLANIGAQRESPEMRMALDNIAQVDREIQQKIFQLGQAYYEENKAKEEGELEEKYAPFVQMVKKLEENRKGYYKNKLRLEGLMMCENCGVTISYGSVFCNQCGKKADEKSEDGGMPVNVPETPKCSQCGAVLKEGSLFCTSCGAKRG
nr:zinc ribbon domain-containing protein [uncultured Acetatifactor sp.]